MLSVVAWPCHTECVSSVYIFFGTGIHTDAEISDVKGLDYCPTAPIGTIESQRELLINSHEINVTRSKTYKESLRHDLKLDRLSELDKVIEVLPTSLKEESLSIY